MTNEPKPFLTADSVGKEFVTRGGAKVEIIACTKDNIFVARQDTHCWFVKPNGRYYSAHQGDVDGNCGDLLPPAPPEPEQRTVWLNVYHYWTRVHPSKDAANSAFSESECQGNPVPVPLERGADGNWHVVAELTPKQKAADSMYEALKICDEYLRKCFGSASDANPYPALAAALAKAEGRS